MNTYLLAGSLAALVFTSNGLGQCYEIIELESIGGDSMANDINDLGWAVGEAQDAEGLKHAVLWIDGIPTDLGTLGGEEAIAVSLNNVGQIVGWSQDTEGNARAFLWEEGKMIDLGTLGGQSSYANAINDSSQIVGYSSLVGGGGHAFIWQDGKMTDLGTLTGEGESFGWGINEEGIVVGHAQVVDGTHAFLWDNGKMIDLGTLGGDTSWGLAINSANQVVGRSYLIPNEGMYLGYVWQDGVMTELDSLDGNSTSQAKDINDAVQIAGTTNNCAVIWEDGFVTCLTDVLPQNTEWQNLDLASGINANGQIAGRGTINGEIRGFVLTQTSDCQCDFNCNGTVDTGDLLVLLGSWGSCFNCDNCPADLNGDCQVNTSDLLFLLANWG